MIIGSSISSRTILSNICLDQLIKLNTMSDGMQTCSLFQFLHLILMHSLQNHVTQISGPVNVKSINIFSLPPVCNAFSKVLIPLFPIKSCGINSPIFPIPSILAHIVQSFAWATSHTNNVCHNVLYLNYCCILNELCLSYYLLQVYSLLANVYHTLMGSPPTQ